MGFKEILRYILIISIVWAFIVGAIVFKFTDTLEIKDLQIKSMGFVVGELSKGPCNQKLRDDK